ncbi:ABC transporter substrate-binding protein [Roseovarius sp. D0-M9]|uniref:ABC transporter substrate-binding protein n=1 Tax=Roseovarius sp. D0-M9 TaxID=3127117 RepID=UPI00300F8AD4
MKKTQKISRRAILKSGAAATTLSMLPLWAGRAEAACGTLRAGITGYNVINTLDPAQMTLIPEAYVVWGVFNCLLKFDEDMNIVPDLAESYESVSPTLLRFKLREGVKFHDGEPMTSADVKFTLERLKDDTTASPHQSKFAPISEIRTPDDLTVEIETSEPFAPMLSYLTNTRTGSQIVPMHLLKDGTPDDFGTNPVGTGPFKLAEYQPGASLTLTAHTEYFEEGLPKVNTVEIPLIAEESAGVTALLGGSVDVTSTAPFADIPDLEKDDRVQVLKAPGANTRFVSLNNAVAPFDDVHFRRACSLAFDRQAMVDVVLFGEGRVASGIIPNSITWAATQDQPMEIGLNAEEALKELEMSKYGPGTEAAVLTWGSGWWKRFAEVYVLQVNQVLGVNFNVEVSDSGTVYQRKQAGDFQASIWGWLGLIDPDEYAYEIYHTNGSRNYEKYSNPEVDALLEEARRTVDLDARGELYREAEALAIQDCPVLPCFESNVHNLLAPKVQGFVQRPYSGFGAQLAEVGDC